jgi:two-component system nitrogen regulation response regulator GlnG
VLTPDDFDFLEREAREQLRTEDLPRLVAQEVASALEQPEAGNVYRDILDRVERPLLEAVLARTRGNQVRAAALLGINRNTLRKKITELTIPLPERPPP